jgi:hypothetical protein
VEVSFGMEWKRIGCAVLGVVVLAAGVGQATMSVHHERPPRAGNWPSGGALQYPCLPTSTSVHPAAAGCVSGRSAGTSAAAARNQIEA